MDESLESQMINALEIFHYESKFRDKLFAVVLDDDVNIKNIIDDLRVIYASNISVIIFCQNKENLKTELELWTERGTKFKLFGEGIKAQLSARKMNSFKKLIQQNTIPVIAFDNPINHQAFEECIEVDQKILEISELLNAYKIFFLSSIKGLIFNSRFHSNPSTEQIREFLKSPDKINIGTERLEFIHRQNIESGIEIVLLEGKVGSLFQEIFTHRGAGTLFTQDYPNDSRKAELKDVTDIMLLIKPYIISGEILPISEDDIAKNIEDFYVYTINSAIVALSRIIDYGDAAELGKFCTIPRFQGKGRARKLAQRLIDEAKATGKKYVFALSIEKKMWDFFESLGFYFIERETLPKEWQSKYNFNRPSKALRFDL